MRTMGKSRMVPTVPVTCSNHRKSHITSPWGTPATGSTVNRLHKQGQSRLGMVSPVCVAVHVARHTQSAASSPSDQAAACLAHPQA